AEPNGGHPHDAMARPGEQEPATRTPAARRVPGDIDAVAEGTAPVGVGRDHRLVIEVVGAPAELEESGPRPGAAAVGRARHRHLRALDALAVAVSEEDDDVR